MHATTGDRLVIRGRNVGHPVRIGVVTEVRGSDGSPPFIVKWLDTERECLVFPGSDAVIEHHEEPTASHTGSG